MPIVPTVKVNAGIPPPVTLRGLRRRRFFRTLVDHLVDQAEFTGLFRGQEAIALQGYEEGRHAAIIRLLTERYGIPVDPFEDPKPPKDPTWAFLRTGYGECLDSFFAFGLFAIGRRSEFFPAELIGIFEPIMQEEARHILFIVNWAAYLRAREPFLLRPLFDSRRGWNIVSQAFDRVRGAFAMGKGTQTQDGFTIKSHASFGDFSARSFLELCLAENDRRLAPYDPRLLRPTLVPSLVRAALNLMPKKNGKKGAAGDSAA